MKGVFENPKNIPAEEEKKFEPVEGSDIGYGERLELKKNSEGEAVNDDEVVADYSEINKEVMVRREFLDKIPHRLQKLFGYI